MKKTYISYYCPMVSARISMSPFQENYPRRLITYGTENTIYLRDIDWVQRRLKEGRKYSILGSEV